MVAFHEAVRDLLRSLNAGDTHRSAMFWPMAAEKAEARAIQLLTQNLSPAQREQYETRRYFEVIGGDTGKRYRIRHGCQLNVEQLDQNGRRLHLWCFMPRGGLPVGDIMLAQKIALELFESEAIMVANKSPVWDLELELRL